MSPRSIASLPSTADRPASVALVTGGSRGLGRSMALHLAQRGVDVILTYQSRADDAEKVVEQDFYLRSHRYIFAAMTKIAEANAPIDLITVSEWLERNQQLDDVGGFAYLGEIAKNTPSAANILAYADIVRERAVVRDMISVAHDIADAGYDPQGRSSAELLDFAEISNSSIHCIISSFPLLENVLHFINGEYIFAITSFAILEPRNFTSSSAIFRFYNNRDLIARSGSSDHLIRK